MPEYLAYRVDKAGNAVGAAWRFDSAADHEALERVRAELDGYAVELWVGDRRVGFAVPHATLTRSG